MEERERRSALRVRHRRLQFAQRARRPWRRAPEECTGSPIPLLLLTTTLVALALVAWASRAALVVCVIEVRDGRLAVARGGIAPRVLADLGDVVARPRVARATLRIVRSRGTAEVTISGDLSSAQQQQIRNVVGSVPLAALRNARSRR